MMIRTMTVCAAALGLSAAAVGEQVDNRVRTLIHPVRVVATFPKAGENYGDPAKVIAPEALLAGAPQQKNCGGVWKTSGCQLVNSGVAPGIVLDFGREIHGGLQIMNCSQHGMKVRVRFGESVGETLVDVGDRGASNDHAIRDGVYSVPHMGAMEIGNTGFRFVRIDLVTAGKLALDCVRAVSLMRPMKRLGAFKSSDERLNRIWETAVQTVHLCCQDQLWDGIKRDRLVWMGDTHPESMAILNVFGADAVLPETLDYAMHITDPDEKWMMNMAPYTLWWLRNVYEWYFFTGDAEYVRQRGDYIRRTVRHCLSTMKDGTWECPRRVFLDWPSQHDLVASKEGLQGLAAITFENSAEFAKILGDAALEADCRAAVAALRKRGGDARGCKQAAAMLALSDLAEPKRMFDEVLGKNGHEGVSTFYGYYMLEAMSKSGANQRALDTIRDFWGAMLDVGATSFWENFSLAWTNNCFRIDELPIAGKKDIHGDYGEFCYPGFRHSLCHGWSCGPASWCIQHVLGIRVLESGCRSIEIKPFLGDLDWAEGAMALPDGGCIKVRVEKRTDGTLKTDVKCDMENVKWRVRD